MAHNKIPYPKKAKSIDEQIDKLRDHGIEILNESKAKECLSDIGYYRLGFYIHPFEITYPAHGRNRSHNVRPGTKIEDVVALYYFDFDIRNILNRYLARIEVAIRTTVVNELSNKYIDNPTWFVDPNVVSQKFIEDFPSAAYNAIRKNEVIKRHHNKYIGQYAPAWKTIEYMTLGNIETLYDSLIWDNDKKLISNRFGEPAIGTFKSYLSAIRELRNACAHGKVIFDLKLINGIRSGRACSFSGINRSRNGISGVLAVVDFLLKTISVNRAIDMHKEISAATLQLYAKTPSIRQTIETLTGIVP